MGLFFIVLPITHMNNEHGLKEFITHILWYGLTFIELALSKKGKKDLLPTSALVFKAF